ncbi:MAG: hypothetical protein ACLRNQ_01745 [Flavonifractor plautii]
MKERSALAIARRMAELGNRATPLPPIPWLWPTPGTASRTSSWRPLFTCLNTAAIIRWPMTPSSLSTDGAFSGNISWS